MKPYYYVKDREIFQRPILVKNGVRMGFLVCTVNDGVDPNEVCALLNKAEPVKEKDTGSIRTVRAK